MDRRTEYEVIGGHKHAVPERYFDTDDVVQALAAYEDTGLGPQEITPRLRELAQADREGRIVVLPCKVGDTVYVITKVFNGNKIERAIGSRKIDRIGGNALNPVWVVSTQPYELDFFPSEFGRTVFLTREEAEKALTEMEGKKDD